MIWTKIWNSINRLAKFHWSIILAPYTKEEIEMLKEMLGNEQKNSNDN